MERASSLTLSSLLSPFKISLQSRCCDEAAAFTLLAAMNCWNLQKLSSGNCCTKASLASCHAAASAEGILIVGCVSIPHQQISLACVVASTAGKLARPPDIILQQRHGGVIGSSGGMNDSLGSSSSTSTFIRAGASWTLAFPSSSRSTLSSEGTFDPSSERLRGNRGSRVTNAYFHQG